MRANRHLVLGDIGVNLVFRHGKKAFGAELVRREHVPLAKAQMDPSEEHRVGDEGGQRAAVPDVDVLAELMRAPDGRRAADIEQRRLRAPD